MSAEDYIGRDHDLSRQYKKPKLGKDNKKKWVSNMDTKDNRNKEEIWKDFYKNGFQ